MESVSCVSVFCNRSLILLCGLFHSSNVTLTVLKMCVFDGLRYGAAFIGFDEFVLVPQAILLTIDTFGFSHILSVFGLPLFVAFSSTFNQTEHKSLFSINLFWVWGLFAPKFVSDVVGLILIDVLIFVASIYYFNG
ncbi:hypothetical protein V6N12_024082 [Hibiscus sabdariffa]|uniref:Uncharacterized protein n=1 Tax=Hibiscus sabdariffa TaxID=183260 RepID=A0ABR2FZI2_9ROSI